MNDIEKLLAEHCPNGVEWKELGEVAIIENNARKPVKASLRISGNIPYYGANNVQDYVDGFTHNGEYVLVAEDGSASLENYSIQWATGKFWANNHVHVLKGSNSLISRFLFHYLRYMNFIPYLSGGGRAKLTKAKLIEIKLPIPPLAVQEKIVEILDKFTEYVTELTRELTRELTLRQKQYAYYRDKLLSFDDDVYEVEWKTLGEIGKVSMCKRILKGQTSERGEIPFYKIGTFGKEPNSFISRDLFEEYKTKFSYPQKGDVLISASGTIGRTVIFDGKDSYFQDSNIVWIAHDESVVLNRYLYYIYQTNPWKISNGGTISRLYNGDIEKTKLPVPPLSVQEKIVQVLDKFDAVCNDLNIGLPKEIELRQKQYEYFRDKLLTFTAAGVYTDSTVQYRQDLIRLLQWVFGPIRVQLGAVINLSRGKRLTRSQLKEDGSYPVYQNSLKPLGYYQEFNRSADTTFVICAGAAGEIAYSSLDFWAADDVFTLEKTTFISSRFMYHTLLNIQGRIKDKVRKASIPRLSKTVLENIVFILPPFTEQQRIVSILDKFDTLTSDLSQGLPKEIELRQKEYEYFRDKLLDFN